MHLPICKIVCCYTFMMNFLKLLYAYMTNYCAAAVQFVLSVIEASFQEGVEREKIPLSDV